MVAVDAGVLTAWPPPSRDHGAGVPRIISWALIARTSAALSRIVRLLLLRLDSRTTDSCR